MATPIYYPPLVNNLQKEINADYTAGATTVTLNNTTNIQNKPGVCVVNRVNSAGTRQAVANWTYLKFTGISGSTLTGVTAISGDQDHAIGEIVEFVPDITWAEQVAGGFATLLDSTDVSKVKTSLPLTTPQITTSINDANGNEVIKTPATTDAVNEVTVTNAATGNSPSITATGGDTNIGISIAGKGSGVVNITTPVVKTAYAIGAAGATETVNWANGDLQTMTLDENVTITFSNAVAGQRLTLFLLQDGTGTNTITWADTITWQDGITWGDTYYTKTADKMNVVVIYYSGSAYFGMVGKFA